MNVQLAHHERSTVTRGRLLDAAEALVADDGYAATSQRSIARRAGIHVALVNYHFGSKDMLLEAVVARRAGRLVGEWRRALAGVAAVPRASVERILRAYWAPFDAKAHEHDDAWRNYLCAVARLSQAQEGGVWWTRQFGDIEEAFHDALERALPGVPPGAVERGFRYARELLDAILLRRCNKPNGGCEATPPGLREDDVDGMIAFLAAGLEGLPVVAPTTEVCMVRRRSFVAAD
jgi:AcrR family transcriptional regulator